MLTISLLLHLLLYQEKKIQYVLFYTGVCTKIMYTSPTRSLSPSCASHHFNELFARCLCLFPPPACPAALCPFTACSALCLCSSPSFFKAPPHSPQSPAIVISSPSRLPPSKPTDIASARVQFLASLPRCRESQEA
jgi:hypothetical protein